MRLALNPMPKDHPRVSGEHLVDEARRITSVGSSPRERGARVGLDYLVGAAGIIPA